MDEDGTRSGGLPAGLLQRVKPACKDKTKMFFSKGVQTVEKARSLCMGCVYRPGCLKGAIERGEECGVWGGELISMGRIVPAITVRGAGGKSKNTIHILRGHTEEERVAWLASNRWNTQ